MTFQIAGMGNEIGTEAAIEGGPRKEAHLEARLVPEKGALLAREIVAAHHRLTIDPIPKPTTTGRPILILRHLDPELSRAIEMVRSRVAKNVK